MSYLKKLFIRGFQSHKNTTIEFGPNITTITGPTDVGKSSIIRSLYWLIKNKPGGDSFINWNSDDVKVILEIDKNKICRQRGKTKNQYKIKEGNQVQVYEAFKNDVPSEVKNILNVDDLNFQFQFDAPYWFANTAGEVSRQLNQIVDLGIIDQALSKIAGGLRKAKTEVDICKARKEDADNRLHSLQYIKEMKQKFSLLQRIKKKQQIALQTAELLTSIIQEIDEQEIVLENIGRVVGDGKEILQIGEKWNTARNTSKEIKNYLENIEVLEELSNCKIPNIKILEEIEIKYKKANQMTQNLLEAIEEIEEKEADAWQKEKSHEKKMVAFHQQAEGICPLCGSVIES